MKNLRNRTLTLIFLVTVGILLLLPLAVTYSQNEDYYRIVVVSDLHYPYKYLEVKDPEKGRKIVAAKTKVVDDINSWPDVDAVVLLGDLVGQTGSAKEYGEVKKFLTRFNKPLSYVVGNHDYLYKDQTKNGKMSRGDASSQSAQLQRFCDTYGVSDIYRSKRVGSYLLVYLATDMLNTKFSTEISLEQLKWFSNELKANRHIPTIVFFHAPLENTLGNYQPQGKIQDKYAQPIKKIENILHDNPQVFMWVSGHTHTAPTNPAFNSPVNLYQGHVWDIHNADLNREKIYTNSFYLYSDKVLVRTFNHSKKSWDKAFDRTIPLPSNI